MIQVLREVATDYNSFVNEITDKVKKMMGEGYSVRIYKVTKNNSMELDSLVLLKQGKNFAPNIYLHPYYEAYVEGLSINELAQRLCDIYKNCTLPITEEFSYTFEEMKPNIIYRLVSFERNKKLLEQVPHIKYLDLAITFHCLVREDDDGIGTIRITNEHMHNWNTSLQELQLLAMGNTKILFPSTIRCMDDVIKGMLTDELFQSRKDFNEDIQECILSEEVTNNQHKMYILSNLIGINGASCLLYEDVLREFAKHIHSDLYILPSSIHEIILVPFDKTMKREALAEMVRDVNRTQVAREEVLSDCVYYFSRKNNTITM